jgi:hypothetical protein
MPFLRLGRGLDVEFHTAGRTYCIPSWTHWGLSLRGLRPLAGWVGCGREGGPHVLLTAHVEEQVLGCPESRCPRNCRSRLPAACWTRRRWHRQVVPTFTKPFDRLLSVLTSTPTASPRLACSTSLRPAHGRSYGFAVDGHHGDRQALRGGPDPPGRVGSALTGSQHWIARGTLADESRQVVWPHWSSTFGPGGGAGRRWCKRLSVSLVVGLLATGLAAVPQAACGGLRLASLVASAPGHFVTRLWCGRCSTDGFRESRGLLTRNPIWI